MIGGGPRAIRIFQRSVQTQQAVSHAKTGVLVHRRPGIELGSTLEEALNSRR